VFRFFELAETLGFVLDVWIFGQVSAGALPKSLAEDLDPSIDLDLYLSIFALE
jgi:hypothetical protein